MSRCILALASHYAQFDLVGQRGPTVSPQQPLVVAMSRGRGVAQRKPEGTTGTEHDRVFLHYLLVLRPSISREPARRRAQGGQEAVASRLIHGQALLQFCGLEVRGPGEQAPEIVFQDLVAEGHLEGSRPTQRMSCHDVGHGHSVAH